MQFIDSHCHLDNIKFDNDRLACVNNATQHGIIAGVIPAITAASWLKQTQICQTFPQYYPAYGLHPVFLSQHQPSHLNDLRFYIQNNPCVAVGECGLDFSDKSLSPEEQLFYFEEQLKIAKEFDLPVIIHARDAVEAVIQSCRKISALKGVVHSFSGSLQQAEQLFRLGFLLGFGGVITYSRATRVQAVATNIPIDAILLESDAPDQPDSGIAGQRNEPARVAFIAQELARLRQQSLYFIAEKTTLNAQKLFSLRI